MNTVKCPTCKKDIQLKQHTNKCKCGTRIKVLTAKGVEE